MLFDQNILQQGGQFGYNVGLSDETGRSAVELQIADFVIGISGCENDSQIGVHLPRLFGHPGAQHAVGQHKHR